MVNIDCDGWLCYNLMDLKINKKKMIKNINIMPGRIQQCQN